MAYWNLWLRQAQASTETDADAYSHGVFVSGPALEHGGRPGPTTGDIELVELAGSFPVEALASVVTANPKANLVFDPSQAAFTNAAACLPP